MNPSRWPTLAALLVSFLSGAPALRAQSGATRAALEAYQDSLRAIATIDHLKQVERVAGVESRARGDAVSALRLGSAVLRRAETEDGRHFDRARDTFEQARELEPDWAYPLLGIGLAEAGKGDWLAAEPLNIGTRVGHGAYRSAVRALIAAAEKEPQLTPALLELDRVASELRDTLVERAILNAVRNAVAAGNHEPAVLLVLGRRERSAGRGEASIAVLERYLASRHDSSLARLEIARTQFTEGQANSDSLYFSAASSDDSATIAELRADLVPIADARELARFDATRGAERQRFLRQLWEDRARRDLRPIGERLREHYRRLRFARHHFALSNNRRYYGFRDVYRAPRSETLDDRGVVYVRHGEPDQRLTPLLFGLLPNETWLYRRADGDLLMHFSGGGEGYEGGDLTDYRLVPSVFDLRGDQAPMDMRIASRFAVSDLYEKIMAWGPHGAARARAEEHRWGETSAETGTTTDAFELKFPAPLEVKTDMVTIGRRGTRPLLQVIYALPGTPAGTSLRFRISLSDSLGSVPAWLDSTASTEAMGTHGSGGRFELPVPPGKWYYRFALEVGPTGRVTPRDSIVIPDLGNGRISISGIAFGQTSENLRWVAGPADTALLNPVREFVRDGELQLYYEVYELEARAPYAATVVVYEKRGDRVGRSRLRFSFEEEGQGVITRVRRRLLLTGLEPREYWLEVSVRDGSGAQVIRRKWFRVISVAQ